MGANKPIEDIEATLLATTKSALDELVWCALLRKMQYGIHHQIGAQHLDAYANELAWRQDNREMKESEKIKFLLTRCLNMPPSQRWSKYWQRRKTNGA